MTVRIEVVRGHRHSGSVRIIGGNWRGRKLAVVDNPGLRPSPDRVRETLFNWLAPYLDGAQCLDLFAGSGVLGLESLSRGATSVTFVENDPSVAAMLRHHISVLAARSANLIEGDASTWLRKAPASGYDIVFLDPPFAKGYAENVLSELKQGWLKPHAKVYLETEKLPILHLEVAGWRKIKEGHTHQITYALLEMIPNVASTTVQRRQLPLKPSNL